MSKLKYHLLPKYSKKSNLNVRKHSSVRFQNLLKASQFHRFMFRVRFEEFHLFLSSRSGIISIPVIVSKCEGPSRWTIGIIFTIGPFEKPCFAFLEWFWWIMNNRSIFTLSTVKTLKQYHPFHQNNMVKLLRLLQKIQISKSVNTKNNSFSAIC